MTGTWAIGATIAVALLLVAASWCLLLAGGANPRTQKLARWAWTLGFLFYVGHVACAFGFVHHWSHAEAARHTADRTWQAVGWRWGGGLWINYFFTVLWGADVIYWWRGSGAYRRRPALVSGFVHAFFAFMIFQAGVVFASGTMRWGVAAGLAIVGGLGLTRLLRSP